jgi:hypothetical protein
MVAWPSVFPNPDVGVSYEIDSRVDVLKMDSGEFRQRPVRQSRRYVFPVTFTFSDLTLAMFNAWFAYKIESGATWFDLELPVNGGGTETRSVRFFEPSYQITLSIPPSVWTVTAQLETLT